MAINQVSALMSWPDPEWLADIAHIIWVAFSGAVWVVHIPESLVDMSSSLGGLLLNDLAVAFAVWMVNS